MLKEIEPGIYLLRVIVPFPVKYVNSYLLRGEKGWSIVDCGYNDPAGRQVWLDAFRELSLDPRNVTSIYITHAHPDHFGLAGWLQELTGAVVYMSDTEAKNFESTWSAPEYAEILYDFCLANGMPTEIAAAIASEPLDVRRGITPLPQFKTVKDNQTIDLGNKPFRALITPGHSSGHLCFFNQETNLLISGDQLLPKITPNISLWPDDDPNPLQGYLKSLRRLARLNALKVLPSHGSLFENANSRINEVLYHHDERLAMTLNALDGSKSGYEVSQAVFGLLENPLDQRFALTETLAHLEFYVAQNKAHRLSQKVILYKKAC